MASSAGYFTQLSRALKTYEGLSGTRIQVDELDPKKTEVRAAYDSFRRRIAKTTLGANSGERMAFEIGIKPLIRDIISPQEWEAKRQHFTGLHVATLAMSTRMDPLVGFTIGQQALGDLEGRGEGQNSLESDAVGRSEGGRLIVIAGRDQDRVTEAYEIDKELVGTVGADDERELVIRHGELLGYPTCCAHFFASLLPSLSNRDSIEAASRASQDFHPLLNNLSLGFFHYIAWAPCSYACQASINKAHALDQHLQTQDPKQREQVFGALSMPRLYLDDRRQILFEGYYEDEGVLRYSSVHTPYALDRSTDAVHLEWVFFWDWVRPFLKGDRIEINDGQVSIFAGRELLTRRPFDNQWILLPFDSSKKGMR